MKRLFRSDLADKKPSVISVPTGRHMMCLNESSLDPYQAIKESFLKRMEKIHLNRYLSPVTDELHLKLADYAGTRPENVVWANGADDILYHVFLAVRENADSFAVSLAPSYFDYGTFCAMVGLKIKYLALNEDFSFDTDEYLRLASHPDCRLAILCNPNNPTGNLFDMGQLRQIVEGLRDKLVLIDETYHEFSGATFVGELEKHPNLMLARSFSKAFSGAGLRFGYAISSEENIHELKKVLTTFHTSILNQAFALSILENAGIFREQVQNVASMREEMYRGISSLPGFTVHPSQTNFLAFSAGERTGRLFEFLKQKGVAVRDVGSHPLLSGHLRVTISSGEDNRAFLDALKEFSLSGVSGK
ncbi:MAG: pyridoxal phosphate-dependent aminotransferase [Candidatus Syntrophosphaera sp.]